MSVIDGEYLHTCLLYAQRTFSDLLFLLIIVPFHFYLLVIDSVGSNRFHNVYYKYSRDA